MVYLYLPPRKYNMNALNFYMEILEENYTNAEHIFYINTRAH